MQASRSPQSGGVVIVNHPCVHPTWVDRIGSWGYRIIGGNLFNRLFPRSRAFLRESIRRDHVIFANARPAGRRQSSQADRPFFIEAAFLLHTSRPAGIPASRGQKYQYRVAPAGFFHGQAGNIPLDLPWCRCCRSSRCLFRYSCSGNPGGLSPDMSLDEISHSLLMQ